MQELRCASEKLYRINCVGLLGSLPLSFFLSLETTVELKISEVDRIKHTLSNITCFPHQGKECYNIDIMIVDIT